MGESDSVDVGALNAFNMVLLPKDEAGVVDGQALEVERSPVAIRPMPLSTIDVELMARICKPRVERHRSRNLC